MQGLYKTDIREHYGGEQVHRWRRGFVECPPRLSPRDHRHPRRDARYWHLPVERLPYVESLTDTMARVTACWEEARQGLA